MGFEMQYFVKKITVEPYVGDKLCFHNNTLNSYMIWREKYLSQGKKYYVFINIEIYKAQSHKNEQR